MIFIWFIRFFHPYFRGGDDNYVNIICTFVIQLTFEQIWILTL